MPSLADRRLNPRILARAGLLAAGGGGGIITPYEGLIGTRCRSLILRSSGNNKFMSRTVHYAADDIDTVKLAIANFRMSDSVVSEQAPGGPVTVAASIEFPLNGGVGALKQVLFSGAATKVIADGILEFSDYTLGSLGISRGDLFGVRIWRDSSAGSAGVLYNGWRNAALDERGIVGASAVDQTMTDTGPLLTSSSNQTSPPFGIIGPTTRASGLIIGDSNHHGQSDTAESATAAGAGIRGAIAKSFGPIETEFPFLNISTGAMKAALWSTYGTQRQKMFPYASHYYSVLGRNDHAVNDSPNTIRANLEAIHALILAANPNAKIIGGTLFPTSGTSDNWATTGNQTPDADAADWVTFNNLVRNGQIGGINHGYVELANQLTDAVDVAVWKATGAAFGYTPDGIHGNAAGYNLIRDSGAVDLSMLTYP